MPIEMRSITAAGTRNAGAPAGMLTASPPQGCLLCGEPTSAVLSHVTDNRFGMPGEYEISRCSSCGLEQTLPRPLPSELKRLYEIYYNFGGESGTAYTRMREWFFASRLYKLWMALDGDGSFHARRGSGRLLDVGCNEGRGLKIHRRNGFDAEGLELNGRAARLARNAGFVVHEELLENFYPGTGYDVVVLSNVLEHSLDPRQMLLDIKRILRPGGQVWIACPNSESRFRGFFGRAWINWHVPFHIVHFSRTRLERLLTETDFTNAQVQQITPALWVASSTIAAVFGKDGRATRQLRNPFLILAGMSLARFILFPFLFMANRRGQGDCLLATASSSGSNLQSGSRTRE